MRECVRECERVCERCTGVGMSRVAGGRPPIRRYEREGRCPLSIDRSGRCPLSTDRTVGAGRRVRKRALNLPCHFVKVNRPTKPVNLTKKQSEYGKRSRACTVTKKQSEYGTVNRVQFRLGELNFSSFHLFERALHLPSRFDRFHVKR